MPNEFDTITWDSETEENARRLIRLALQEDLNGGQDLTSHSLADPQGEGAARFVPREQGVAAGLLLLPMVAQEADVEIQCDLLTSDGQAVQPGEAIAMMRGRALDLLTCERTMLNFLGRLSGIAWVTRRFVELTTGTKARIYDTRKTTPGWRRLEKYAVQCGGGANHRMGLFDAVLIKDNHLAHSSDSGQTPGDAVRTARAKVGETTVVEVEVDSLDQLQDVLPSRPDIVLLDNMSLDQLRQAVALRDQQQPNVVLEASGGVRLDTVKAIAGTGVDRISVGALTHSSGSLDIGLDWS